MNEQASDPTTYPRSIVCFGERLHAVGLGAYPYDCRAADLYPDAMIYRGDGTWTHSGSYSYEHRDRSQDVYTETN